MGMLMADVIKDYSFTVMRNQDNATAEELSELFSDLEKKGIDDLFSEGISEDNVGVERYLDMRYEGQSYEIMVPFDAQYEENFHALHEKNYGYRNQEKTVEIVNLRLRALGTHDKVRFEKAEKTQEQPPKGAFVGECEVVFDQEVSKTRVIARDKLLSGNKIWGPAILVEYSSTIVIPPWAEASVDEYGNVIMEIMD
jgi:N-methylhydantoinase A